MGEKRGMKALELWCRRVTDGYPGVKIDNMTTSWRDGLAFCALIHHFRPDLIDFDRLDRRDIYKNNELAFSTAERHLGIPALLDAEDMVEYEVPDRLSILTYLSQFYQTFVGSQRATPSPPNRTSDILSTPTDSPPQKIGPGRIETCWTCNLPVFLAQRLVAGGKLRHRSCFKCARCGCQLNPAGCYETEAGAFVCETCPDEEVTTLTDEQKTKIIDKYSMECENVLDKPPIDVNNVNIEDLNQRNTASCEDVDEHDSTAQHKPAFVQSRLKIFETKISNEKLIEDVINNVESEEPVVVQVSEERSRIDEARNKFIINLVTDEPVDTKTETDPEENVVVKINVPDEIVHKTDEDAPEDKEEPVGECKVEDDIKEEATEKFADAAEKQEECRDDKLEVGEITKEESEVVESKSQVDVAEEKDGSEVVTDTGQEEPIPKEDLMEVAKENKTQIDGGDVEDKIGAEVVTDVAEEELVPKEGLMEVLEDKVTDSSVVETGDGNKEALVAQSESNYPEELNPFGEEEEMAPVPVPRRKPQASPRNVKAARKVIEAPVTTLNPFWSDGEPSSEEEGTPVPMPRHSLKTPDATPRSSKYGSTSSLSSLSSSTSATKKKRRPAPAPPINLNITDSPSSASSLSPISTLRSRKSRPAPLPPSWAKSEKDEENKMKQNMPDKSTYGQWKRKKGPAPSVPIPQKRRIVPLLNVDVKRELEDLEIQQRELERQGVTLEQTIRQYEDDNVKQGNDPWEGGKDVEGLILQLFELVNEKNELFRRQAELMYLRRQQRLEEEYADLEYQIRCLMLQPECNKTDTDKAQEEELIKRLVDVVERRNEIIDCLDMDRKREAEEDQSIMGRLETFASRSHNREDGTRTLQKSSKSLLKLIKKKKKKDKDKDKKKQEKHDADKDIDESVKEVVEVKQKTKKKWFS